MSGGGPKTSCSSGTPPFLEFPEECDISVGEFLEKAPEAYDAWSNSQACNHQQAATGADCSPSKLNSDMAAMRAFCSIPLYQKTSYCACLNGPGSKPACVFKPCASGQAYLTPNMVTGMEHCPTIIDCTQIQEIGGSGNVVDGIIQKCGIFQSYWLSLKQNPLLVVLLLLLVIFVAENLRPRPPKKAKASEGQAAGPLPPPPLLIPI